VEGLLRETHEGSHPETRGSTKEVPRSHRETRTRKNSKRRSVEGPRDAKNQ